MNNDSYYFTLLILATFEVPIDVQDIIIITIQLTIIMSCTSVCCSSTSLQVIRPGVIMLKCYCFNREKKPETLCKFTESIW